MNKRLKKKKQNSIEKVVGLSISDKKQIISEIEYSNFLSGRVVNVTEQYIDDLVKQIRNGAETCTRDMRIVGEYLKLLEKRGS